MTVTAHSFYGEVVNAADALRLMLALALVTAVVRVPSVRQPDASGPDLLGCWAGRLECAWYGRGSTFCVLRAVKIDGARSGP
jgi:hypothetical protein